MNHIPLFLDPIFVCKDTHFLGYGIFFGIITMSAPDARLEDPFFATDADKLLNAICPNLKPKLIAVSKPIDIVSSLAPVKILIPI